MNSCDTTRNISLGFDERNEGRCGRVGGKRKVTLLNFGLLHLILDILLEFSFIVVGELGEVELGLGGGGEIHGWSDMRLK